MTISVSNHHCGSWPSLTLLPLEIPLDKYKIEKPVFFGATSKDEVCVPIHGQTTVSQFCSNATTHTFHTGHWVPIEAPDELNEQLDKWITSVISVAN